MADKWHSLDHEAEQIDVFNGSFILSSYEAITTHVASIITLVRVIRSILKVL